MSSGVTRTAFGAFDGTGALLTVEAEIGFRPRVVRLVSGGGLVTANWQEGMDEGRGFKRVTAGTMSQIAASAGITPTDKGFTLGADTDLNVSGERVYWEASE